MVRPLVIAAAALSLNGCVSVGGGKHHARAIHYPSYAQESRSLRAAKEAGVLTESDLKRANKGVLKQRLTGRIEQR